MIVLIIIGFLGGLVTGISPCILPVLPVIFATGAASGLPDDNVPTAGDRPADGEPVLVAAGTGTRGDTAERSGGSVATAERSAAATTSGTTDRPTTSPKSDTPQKSGTAGPDGTAGTARAATPARPTGLAARAARNRRPLAVVGGLVLSFAVFTLIGSWLLTALHLPQDLLRNIGLVVLGLVGLGLIVPAVGDRLERPFARLSAGRQHTGGGGFVLGLSLGLVFVPCAGPVLTAIAVVSANHRYGFSSIVLTVAFALGVAVPLLIFALLGQRLAERMAWIRSRAAQIRRIVGVILVLTALVIGLNLTDGLQRALPGYTNALQSHLEANPTAKKALGQVTGDVAGGQLANCNPASPSLQECGTAPALTGITRWLNTPGSQPLTLAGLKGRVVLVDFWTYSCINCQRTLPHVEAWNRSYKNHGLTIIGVHTPEFAFEHVVPNVSAAAHQLGVTYPIAMDNNYATWNAYENQYWPAEYLIDATGHVRHVDFGEGEYGQTESFIRQLLVAADPKVVLPKPTDLPDLTPTEQTTPESYLGYQHPESLTQQVDEDQMTNYPAPATIPQNEYAYAGNWLVGAESSTAGQHAVLSLNFVARDVYLVLGGTGTVDVSVNGKPTRTVVVSGVPRLYQLVGGTGTAGTQQGLLTLSVSPGVQAYDFTFG